MSVHVCPLSANGARVKTKQKTLRFVRVGVAFEIRSLMFMLRIMNKKLKKLYLVLGSVELEN